ncbi:MAG: HEAT repeat domain-containing protein [Magnetococcales bacterium]|nr:HEAT repeat domain-containing protein [Magnetococcales bacterium]
MLGLQITLPKEGQTAWSATETDMVGRYQANYHIETLAVKENRVVIGKEKHTYSGTFANDNSAIANSTVRVRNSSGKITMAMKGPWLTSLEYKEKMATLSGSYEWSNAESETTLNLLEKNTTGLFPELFAQFTERLQSDRYLSIRYYETDSVLDQMAAGLPLDGAVDLFKQMSQTKENNDEMLAAKFMINYLRRHPQASVELIDILDRDSHRERLNQEMQLTLWRLLAESGHSEAQKAVVTAISNSSRSEVTRMRALMTVHGFEHPQPFLVDELFNFYKQDTSSTDGAKTRQMKSMAMLAIGDLGQGEKLNEETKTKVGILLETQLGQVQSADAQLETLVAIGNYGDKQLAPKVEPFFTAEDERVRASAYTAMRRMDDPAIMNALIQHYGNESSTKVKTVALKTIGDLTLNQDGLKWANSNALAVTHPAEQIIMVDILGKSGKSNPENLLTLKEMLKTNPDMPVKRTIYKYIVPGQ